MNNLKIALEAMLKGWSNAQTSGNGAHMDKPCELANAALAELELCDNCEGMAVWIAKTGGNIITCGGCIGTGNKTLSGPKLKPFNIEKGRREK